MPGHAQAAACHASKYFRIAAWGYEIAGGLGAMGRAVVIVGDGSYLMPSSELRCRKGQLIVALWHSTTISLTPSCTEVTSSDESIR